MYSDVSMFRDISLPSHELTFDWNAFLCLLLFKTENKQLSCVNEAFMEINIYRPQTKFGTRYYFYTFCHSVQGGGGLCMMSGFLVPCFFCGVIYLWSNIPSGGRLCLGGLPFHRSPSTETSLDRDTLEQRPLLTETLCTLKSGRYTSYWNAFLLFTKTTTTHSLIAKQQFNCIFCYVA